MYCYLGYLVELLNLIRYLICNIYTQTILDWPIIIVELTLNVGITLQDCRMRSAPTCCREGVVLSVIFSRTSSNNTCVVGRELDMTREREWRELETITRERVRSNY